MTIYQCGEQCQKRFPTFLSLMSHQCSTQQKEQSMNEETKPEVAVAESPAGEQIPAEPAKPEEKPKAKRAPKPKGEPVKQEKKIEKPKAEKVAPRGKEKVKPAKAEKKPATKKPAPKSKPVAKKPVKKAASPEKLPGLRIHHEKKPIGPAMHQLKNKLKASADGICMIKGCKTKVGKRGKWCATHKKEVRKLQLKLNNVTWRDRVKRNVAGHHVVYDGRPTEWTAQNRKQAEVLVKAGRAVVDPEEFAKKIVPHIGTLRPTQKAAKA